MGVSVAEAISSPEPSFSEEACKAKAQGVVLLLLVVGKDGDPYDIRLGKSLGMGLDEKAIEAVSRCGFDRLPSTDSQSLRKSRSR
jgi:periplasmic protein TonB